MREWRNGYGAGDRKRGLMVFLSEAQGPSWLMPFFKEDEGLWRETLRSYVSTIQLSASTVTFPQRLPSD